MLKNTSGKSAFPARSVQADFLFCFILYPSGRARGIHSKENEKDVVLNFKVNN
jgi:hypothetical protein